MYWSIILFPLNLNFLWNKSKTIDHTAVKYLYFAIL